MEKTLDVSDLEPCEPLDRTLAAIQALQPGEYLKVIHRQEPRLLYPILEKTGFGWYTRPGGPSAFEIFIWRLDDPIARKSAENAIQG